MDVTQPLLRAAQGGARTRLLVDDRVVVVDAHAGTEPVARANPAFGDGPANLGPRREQPHGLPISPPATLFGRERDLDRLTDALDAGDTAVVSGAAGLGKTALLHHLGATRAHHHPDGAVLLSGRGRSPEDLLFEVFRAFYEVPGRRPAPDDLRRHLTPLQALILIDDVTDPPRLARALAEAAPHSRVALATETEQVGRDAFAELVAGIEARDTLVAGVAFGDALAVDEEDEDEDDEDFEDDDELTAEESDDDAEAHAEAFDDENVDDEGDEDAEGGEDAESDEAELTADESDDDADADAEAFADEDADDESDEDAEGDENAEDDEAELTADESDADADVEAEALADEEDAEDESEDGEALAADEDLTDGDDEPAAAVESTKPAKGSGDDD